jgi:hypothetical protein
VNDGTPDGLYDDEADIPAAATTWLHAPKSPLYAAINFIRLGETYKIPNQTSDFSNFFNSPNFCQNCFQTTSSHFENNVYSVRYLEYRGKDAFVRTWNLVSFLVSRTVEDLFV